MFVYSSLRESYHIRAQYICHTGMTIHGTKHAKKHRELIIAIIVVGDELTDVHV